MEDINVILRDMSDTYNELDEQLISLQEKVKKLRDMVSEFYASDNNDNKREEKDKGLTLMEVFKVWWVVGKSLVSAGAKGFGNGWYWYGLI